MYSSSQKLKIFCRLSNFLAIIVTFATRYNNSYSKPTLDLLHQYMGLLHRVCVCVCAFECVCMYACVCVCVCVCVYVCVGVHVTEVKCVRG